MTIVAVWFEPSEDALWSVADTRISQPGPSGGGTTIMTDSGAKLFAIPIRCFKATMDLSNPKKELYSSSVGYAFAGAVLPATMTVAIASTFLQNLTTVGSNEPPRLGEIAAMIGRLAERFSKEALTSSSGTYGKFTAAVFGWCPILDGFAIYKLEPRLTSSTLQIGCEELRPKDNSAVVSFGSGAARLTDLIAHIREHGDEFHRTFRAPKLAIEALVKQDVGDVGGSLSIGAATRSGFNLYSHVTPIVQGKPDAKICFNGIDLDQDLMVGHYMIATELIA